MPESRSTHWRLAGKLKLLHEGLLWALSPLSQPSMNVGLFSCKRSLGFATTIGATGHIRSFTVVEVGDKVPARSSSGGARYELGSDRSTR